MKKRVVDFRTRFMERLGRRFFVEWLLVGCLGIAVVALGSVWRLTASVDGLVYDRLLSLRALPITPDIVVVEIDNASVAKFGRWPWPRNIHARLLDELAKGKPWAVVYDVLFIEPTQDDAILAKAVAESPTYLPMLLDADVVPGKVTAVRPVPPLSAAAAGLGHINFEVDGDGILRSVAMSEFAQGVRWPQIMGPVYRATTGDGPTLQFCADPVRLVSDPTCAKEGDGRFLIPFSRRSESYAKVSFLSVVEGDIPEGSLRGKIVLIGVTASGLYDRFATPVSGDIGPMPGVFIHANVLDALLSGHEIYPVHDAWRMVGSFLPLCALLCGFLVLSPWRSFLVAAGLCLVTTLLSVALLYLARLWMTPVPAIAGLIAVYPVWNWRRLEMTMSYLHRELRHLADEPYLLPEIQQPHEFGGDLLERQMALVAQATRRVQDMKRFIWDSLDSVPGPILVSDVRGIVLIANQAAKMHFERLGESSPEGYPMARAFSGLMFVKTVEEARGYDVRLHWPTMLDPTYVEGAEVMRQGVEVRDRQQSDHLLHYARCVDADGDEMGWIAGLVDVTALHAAERRREDALRLLSHDMRSPHTSIIALVRIERTRAESARMRESLDRIGRYAERALEMANDFVQLARAESQTYALVPVSLIELVINAVDQVWAQAQAKDIRLETQFDYTDGCWILADPSLMTRALVNVLNNAVKYSPPNTRVVCTVGMNAAFPPRAQCAIRDEGYGIAQEDQAYLFEQFRRFHASELPHVEGTGLGMAFVKTVTIRHLGEISVQSTVGKGTTLILSLPALVETGDAKTTISPD
jgi:CHASE2 domain-containing sensor protein/signal transduction histidine kinase